MEVLLQDFANNTECFVENHIYSITGHWLIPNLPGPHLILMFQFRIDGACPLALVSGLLSNPRAQPIVFVSGIVDSRTEASDSIGMDHYFTFVLTNSARNYVVSHPSLIC